MYNGRTTLTRRGCIRGFEDDNMDEGENNGGSHGRYKYIHRIYDNVVPNTMA